MAAITMTPKSPAKRLSSVLAYAEFSTTLPLPLPIGPKLSEATQKNENMSHSRKYMQVERLLKRNFSSKVKNSQNNAMSDSSSCQALVARDQFGSWRFDCCDRLRK